MARSITGNVLDQRTLQPIGDATLKATGPTNENTTSGPDGSFALINLNAGNYDLLVTKAGYQNGDYGPLVVLDNVPLDINLTLQPATG